MILLLGSPCLTAALASVGLLAVFLLRPYRGPDPAYSVVLIVNAILAVVGSAAGGLLTSGPAFERVGFSLAYGVCGLIVYVTVLVLCAVSVYLAFA